MRPLALAVLALAVGGLFFSLVAAVGLVRLPDVYARAHATSKSDTLGAGLALAAAALAMDSRAASLKVAILVAFVLVTNPVAAHAITRSAYLRDVPPWGSDGGQSGSDAGQSAGDASQSGRDGRDGRSDRDHGRSGGRDGPSGGRDGRSGGVTANGGGDP